MADEAILIVQGKMPVSYTVADGAGIEKGTVLTLSDPRTAAASAATNDLVAGIAATEKISGDGVTSISVYEDGTFKMRASGAIAVGSPVGTTATYLNYVSQIQLAAAGTLSGARVLGYAKETATNGETLLVELCPSVAWSSV